MAWSSRKSIVRCLCKLPSGHRLHSPDGKAWVNRIREQGNEANHEIVVKSLNDAKEVIGFVEMLLKFIYEFPARISPPA